MPNIHRETQLLLQNDHVQLKVLPDIGGSTLSFAAKVGGAWLEVMRNTPDEIKSSSDTSNFLMAPYPNRIRDGRFVFRGKEYQLKFPEKHSIHGDVRNRKWKVVAHDANRCELSFHSTDFADINFPFAFAVKLVYRLDGRKLVTECMLKNIGTQAMPAGFGFHPYFPRALQGHSENIEVQFEVGGVYPTSGPVPLPDDGMHALPKEFDFTAARSLDLNLDHCFGAWKRKALLRWPKSKVELHMEASDAYEHFIVYSPPGQPFVALEPQTQMIDGVNFLERGLKGSGVKVLEPGEQLEAWYSLEVEGLSN